MFLIAYKTEYDHIVGVHEHIMKQVRYCNKMNFSKADIGETSIIWWVLNSVHSHFDVMKTSYDTWKYDWTMDPSIINLNDH